MFKFAEWINIYLKTFVDLRVVSDFQSNKDLVIDMGKIILGEIIEAQVKNSIETEPIYNLEFRTYLNL